GLVGKGRRAVGPAQAVAGNPVVGKCDRGIGRSVIHFVHARGTDRQRPRGDVRRRAGGGIGRVVGRVCTADRDAADTHGLGRTDVLVGETGAGVGGAQGVARQAIVREGDCRVGVAIIHLVRTVGAHAQRTRGD